MPRTWPSCSSFALALALAASSSALGCKRSQPEVVPACDQPALADLATRLDAAKPDARVAMVAEGLLAACDDELSPTSRHHLRAGLSPAEARLELKSPGRKDDALQRLRIRLCPDLDGLDDRLRDAPSSDYGSIVYRHCDLQRYELMSPEEAAAFTGAGWLTWTTHEFLIGDHTPKKVARSISRAMMLFERNEFGLILLQPLPRQRLVELPHASLVPPGVPIYASNTQLVFNEQQLAVLDDGQLPTNAVRGHLVYRLFERLEAETQKVRAAAAQRGEAPELRALLVFDARLPFATVVDIMYTAGQAGFTDYAFIVQTEFPVKKAIELSTARWGVERPPMLQVYIGAEGLRLTERGGEVQTLAKLDPAGIGPAAHDLAKLAKLASAFHDQHPEGMAVVSADSDVRFEVLMSVYAALLGPTCDQGKPETCMVSRLMVEAGAG